MDKDRISTFYQNFLTKSRLKSSFSLFLDTFQPIGFERFYKAKWVQSLADYLITELKSRKTGIWPVICKLAKLITLAELSAMLPQESEKNFFQIWLQKTVSWLPYKAEFELLLRLCMIEIRHALTNDDGESLVLLLELCDQYLSIFANEMANQVVLTKLTDEMLERLGPGSKCFRQPVKLILVWTLGLIVTLSWV